ncbi:MAG TPA: hypothetical protein VM598_08205, partial [Bdellovibrionota bacterium]|nr:hypothetical protein [Bdellovibrionota bacterium]
ESATRLESFRLVFMPGSRTARMLIPYLEEAGVPYVNYDSWDLRKLSARPLFLPHDLHPTAEYYRIFAKYLAQDLGVSRR